MKRHALVLFSGGQDSATCLAWALDRYETVETIGFAYGQRHAVELDCRAPLAEAIAGCRSWRARRGADHLIDIGPGLAALGETALTGAAEIAIGQGGLPTTFVPGRNILFLTYAAALAWRRGLEVLVGGMCETDYSGYPDCRDDTVKAMQVALSLGLDRRLAVHTPLMWIDKADTFALAEELGGAPLVDLVVEETHSCYLGERTQRHAWGYGCGTCPACQLRAKGFAIFESRRKTRRNMK
jgi:7-cyano-7-deazaguanine synthase